jgi:Zn-dependent protease with chaperone function
VRSDVDTRPVPRDRVGLQPFLRRNLDTESVLKSPRIERGHAASENHDPAEAATVSGCAEMIDTPARLPAAVGVEAPAATGAATRVSFFDEQKRRRRQTWRLSLVCLLIALALGVAMSTILAPLALAITAGALKLAALFGCTEVCPKSARAIGLFARREINLLGLIVEHRSNARTVAEKLILIREFLILSIMLLPAMIAGAVAWTCIRLSVRRAGVLDLVAGTGARAPRLEDRKERQLVNAADEMALAAGLATPRVLVIESEVANAAVAGASHEAATVLVTRALLDQLNREQIQAVVAHCIASIGNGDLRVTQSLLATFQTLGLFHTILDLPFRWSAWRSLARFARATFDPRVSPVGVFEASHGIEESFSSQSINPMSAFIIPLLPFRFVMIFQRLILLLWCLLILKWPLELLWRARRYLADSTAVQLTRDPNALATALSLLAPHADIPDGGESRSYLFMCGTERKPRGLNRQDVPPGMFAGLNLEMHPRLDKRLRRLAAMGATSVQGQANERSLLRGIAQLGILRAGLFVAVASPFLLIGGLAALGLVGGILWLSLFTVEISLLLGLTLIALAFGR